jgi:5'-nucleotidase (lipoprotein e(P4) family)
MKRPLTLISFTLCSVLFFSCCSKKEKNDKRADDESVLAILYQQQAAEYRALCLQAYNLAKIQVDDSLRKDTLYNFKYKHKPWAVITDLDETALDNSESEAMFYKDDTTAFITLLKHWWLLGKAKAVPGSVDFFNYVKKKGVDIFYITNRTDSLKYKNSTRINMRHLGFPYTDTTDNGHFRFQGASDPPSKELRRQKVEDTCSVIVLLGDNLIDLDKAFDQVNKEYLSSEQRSHKVDSMKSVWGGKYIVFPNAIYGDWESTFYQKYADNHDHKSPYIAQKKAIRKCLLRTP